MVKKRICNTCKKPMGNSWHSETEFGELELFVHVKCVDEWNKKKSKLNQKEKR